MGDIHSPQGPDEEEATPVPPGARAPAEAGSSPRQQLMLPPAGSSPPPPPPPAPVYVPPSAPPPPRRFQLETTERIAKLRPPPPDVARAYSSRPPPSSPSPSLPALVWSEPPRAASRKWRERVSSTVAAVAGATLGLGVVVCGFLLSKTLVDATRPSGALVVNASGAHHERLLGVEVYVDAKLRCTDVPCKVSDLDRGSHLVRVAANDHQPSADRAVMIDNAEDRVFQVELTRQPTPRP